jgi:hypothetical protein
MGMAGSRGAGCRVERKLLRWRPSVGPPDCQPRRTQFGGSISSGHRASRPVSGPDRASERARRICFVPLATTLASLQNTIAKRTTGESARETDSFELVSVRPEVQFVKLEAKRTRMEHETAARAVHFRLAPAALAPVVFRPLPAPVVCSRVRVNIPQVPMIKMPTVKMPTIKMPAVPTIRIETDSDGPI